MFIVSILLIDEVPFILLPRSHVNNLCLLLITDLPGFLCQSRLFMIDFVVLWFTALVYAIDGLAKELASKRSTKHGTRDVFDVIRCKCGNEKMSRW